MATASSSQSRLSNRRDLQSSLSSPGRPTSQRRQCSTSSQSRPSNPSSLHTRSLPAVDAATRCRPALGAALQGRRAATLVPRAQPGGRRKALGGVQQGRRAATLGPRAQAATLRPPGSCARGATRRPPGASRNAKERGASTSWALTPARLPGPGGRPCAGRAARGCWTERSTLLRTAGSGRPRGHPGRRRLPCRPVGLRGPRACLALCSLPRA